MRSRPELLLVRGTVLTMEPFLSDAEAVAIRDRRIVAVGSTEEVSALAGPGTHIVDLDGHFVVPGFNDCHMHILGLGITLLGADVSPAAGAVEPAALASLLRTWAEEHASAVWIRGYGYNQNVFPGAAHITARLLDGVCPDRPAVVFHASGHAAVANTRALELAGVGADTGDPPGGTIVRDEHGNPTGLLLESAIGLVTRVIPALTRSEKAEAIRRACDLLASEGITSASDMGVGGPCLEDDLEAYRLAVASGASVRMTLCPEVAELWEPDRIPARTELEHDWRLPYEEREVPGCLRLGPLKLYADGALTTRTAALLEPYADGTGAGMLVHDPETLAAYVSRGHGKGWQMATHAIGDRAIKAVVEAYENAAPWPDRRHRVEHAMMPTEEMAYRMARSGIVAVIQPEFLARLGDAYVLGLGVERASRLNPVATLLKAGVCVAFSSDCPVVPGAPLDGIRAAADRTTPSGRVLGADERCDPEEALRSYTESASYATFDELETGCIEPGRRADLTILTALPGLETDTASEVVATISGGQVVYGAERLG